MPSAPGRKGNKPSKQLAAIDRLLIAGIKLGPAQKRDAINRVLELVPHWKRLDCWKRINELRRKAKRAAFEERHPAKAKKSGEAAARRPFRRLWTPADDDRLLNLAGYEPVRRIAQRLDRSIVAVRFRMAALYQCESHGCLVAAGVVEDVARTSVPAELFHRKRPTEGARCTHIGNLPSGVLRSESAIFVPLHPRTGHGCPR